MEILRDKGRPNYKAYFSKVRGIEKVGERGVRFDLERRRRPRTAADPRPDADPAQARHRPGHLRQVDAEAADRQRPLSGRRGRCPPNAIVYKRNPDYWGKDLPIHRGLFNFDEVRVEYYRDANTMFEAFKKGLYDVNIEGDPAQWNTAYDFPAANDGKVVKETFKTGTPKGMSGFVFNTRRPVFADKRVRQALATLFDFDWVNKNLYYGAFVRAAGYFNDSELSAIGKPASDKEKALLAPFPGAVDDDVMNGTYQPVVGRRRRWRARGACARRSAQLQAAGYELKGNQLVNTKTGQPLAFEIMVVNNEDEKLALAYRAHAGPHRHQGRRAQCRGCAVPAAAAAVRLRHGAPLMGRVAVARQRAARPLEQRGRRPAELVQLCRRQRAGDRRHDRRHAGGAHARGFRRRGARARSAC